MDFNFNKDTAMCWYAKNCQNYGTEECRYYCDRYFRLKHLAVYALLSEAQQYPPQLEANGKEEFDTFKELTAIKSNINEFVKAGNNILIYSEYTGNGKTSWATKLIMQYLQSIMWNVSCAEPRALFVNVYDYLTDSKDFGAQNDKLAYINFWLPKVDLVVFDDIPTEGLTSYELKLLYTIINNRIDNRKSNIYTINGSAATMKQGFDSRLFSRIYQMSHKFEFLNNDKRQRAVYQAISATIGAGTADNSAKDIRPLVGANKRLTGAEEE